MSDPLLVGIDLGTTGSRCIIFDSKGRRMASAFREYSLQHLRAGWVEQSLPKMLAMTADACREAAAGIDPHRIAAVGVSTQQCATCPTDSDGVLLRPMISWQDVRAEVQAAAVAEQVGAERFRTITGGPLTPQFTLCKILWLREHEPEIYESARKWPQVQDLVLRYLGAEGFYVDAAQAFFYGLWDVPNLRWSDELLGVTGLDASHFGNVVQAGTQVGQVSRAASKLTGFPAGTPLCVGAGDQACGVVGMGAISPGTATNTLGTAGMLTLSIDKPRTDLPEFLNVNHAVAGLWGLQAVTLAAASSYRWFRDNFGQPEMARAEREGADAFDLLNALAADVEAGADGLLFLPFLNTAGSPYWNTEARAAFVGFLQSHSRAHFVRAVMEGVALEIRDNLSCLAGHGLVPERICLGGGATNSATWNQIQADVYGVPVEVLDEGESTVLGAAILGGVGSGVFTDIDQGVDAMVHTHEVLEPNAETSARYADLYAAYVETYKGLATSAFAKLGSVQAS